MVEDLASFVVVESQCVGAVGPVFVLATLNTSLGEVNLIGDSAPVDCVSSNVCFCSTLCGSYSNLDGVSSSRADVLEELDSGVVSCHFLLSIRDGGVLADVDVESESIVVVGVVCPKLLKGVVLVECLIDKYASDCVGLAVGIIIHRKILCQCAVAEASPIGIAEINVIDEIEGAVSGLSIGTTDIIGRYDNCKRAHDHGEHGDCGQQFGLPSFLVHVHYHRNT